MVCLMTFLSSLVSILTKSLFSLLTIKVQLYLLYSYFIFLLLMKLSLPYHSSRLVVFGKTDIFQYHFEALNNLFNTQRALKHYDIFFYNFTDFERYVISLGV